MVDRNSEALSIIILVLPFAVMCTVLVCHGVPELVTVGDCAVLEIGTRNLFSNSIMLGPYSRFGFYHPGPMYFLLRYPLYRILGLRSSSLLITASIISAVSLVLAWRITRCALGRHASILFCLLLSLLLSSSPSIGFWLTDWNPYVIIFPLLLFCLSIASLSPGSRSALATAAAAGSFAAQTHIGSIPSITMLSILGLVALAFPGAVAGRESEEPSRLPRKSLTVPALLLALLWAPPVYEQVSNGSEGNIARIASVFDSDVPEFSRGEALQAWSGKVMLLESKLLPSGVSNSPHASDVVFLMIAFRMLLLTIGYSLLRRRKGSAFLGQLNLACIFLHIASCWSTLQIRGPLHYFLLEWMVIIGPLSLFSIVCTAVNLYGGRLQPGRAISFARLSALLTIAVFSGVNSVSAYWYCLETIHADSSDEMVVAVRELASQASTYMDADGSAVYLLKLERGGDWRLMLSTVNALDKQGYNLRIAENIWYPERPAPDGSSVVVLRFISSDSTGLDESRVIGTSGRAAIVLD